MGSRYSVSSVARISLDPQKLPFCPVQFEAEAFYSRWASRLPSKIQGQPKITPTINSTRCFSFDDPAQE
jgi:hypothetical protein